jgi:hypothetical protein
MIQGINCQIGENLVSGDGVTLGNGVKLGNGVTLNYQPLVIQNRSIWHLHCFRDGTVSAGCKTHPIDWWVSEQAVQMLRSQGLDAFAAELPPLIAACRAWLEASR